MPEPQVPVIIVPPPPDLGPPEVLDIPAWPKREEPAIPGPTLPVAPPPPPLAPPEDDGAPSRRALQILAEPIEPQALPNWPPPPPPSFAPDPELDDGDSDMPTMQFELPAHDLSALVNEKKQSFLKSVFSRKKHKQTDTQEDDTPRDNDDAPSRLALQSDLPQGQDGELFVPDEVFLSHFAPSSDYIGEYGGDPGPDQVDEEPEKERRPLFPKRKKQEHARTYHEPDAEAKALTPYVRSLGVRTLVACAVVLPLVYLSTAHKFELPPLLGLSYIEMPYIFLLVCVIAQVCVMALALDMIAAGLRDIASLAPSFESVTAVSCIASLAHTLGVMYDPAGGAYLPFCAVSALSVVFLMAGNWLREKALLLSYRTAGSVMRPFVLTRETGLTEGGRPAIKKSPVEEQRVFPAQADAPDITRKLARFYAPLALLAPLLFAIVCAGGEGAPGVFLLPWAGIAAAAAAFPAPFAFALPFFLLSRRLANAGAAIAGWSATRALGGGASLLLTDADLFPTGSVAFNGVKFMTGVPPERSMSCAASLMAATGSVMAKAFSDLCVEHLGALLPVEGLEYFETGGCAATIGGSAILLGTQEFMRRMNVRVDESSDLRYALFLALNHRLAAVFALNYGVSEAQHEGAAALHRADIPVVLALRDFCATPVMLGQRYKVPFERADYPTIENRLRLSDPELSYVGAPAAVIAREGLRPVAECTVGAGRLRKASRLAALISCAGGVVGSLLMFFLMYGGSYAAASPGNLAMFMLMWALPPVLAALWVNRF